MNSYDGASANIFAYDLLFVVARYVRFLSHDIWVKQWGLEPIKNKQEKSNEWKKFTSICCCCFTKLAWWSRIRARFSVYLPISQKILRQLRNNSIDTYARNTQKNKNWNKNKFTHLIFGRQWVKHLMLDQLVIAICSATSAFARGLLVCMAPRCCNFCVCRFAGVWWTRNNWSAGWYCNGAFTLNTTTSTFTT